MKESDKNSSKTSKKISKKDKSSSKKTKRKNSGKTKKLSTKKSSKNNDNKKIINLGIRYIILLLIAFLGTSFFYFVFAPITVHGSYWLLDLFFDATLSGTLILINSTYPIEIISSCVAGSAYLLLTILNLGTPWLKIRQRVESLFFSFAILLVLNIFRIFFLGNLYLFDFQSFDFLHKFFWYFLSIFFVICIWFLQVWIYKIKEIPFVTDIKYLYSLTLSR